jgi:ribosomal protein S18 acetylase RimI-like enzyme
MVRAIAAYRGSSGPISPTIANWWKYNKYASGNASQRALGIFRGIISYYRVVSATFLPLKATDLDRVVALMAKLYASGNSAFDEGNARRNTEKLLDEAEFGGVWLIESENAIAGYLVVVLGYSIEFGGRFGLLDELFVDEPYRGRGLAADAIRFAVAQCRARGWHALRLEVEQKNQRAIDIYRRAGFQLHERYLMTNWMQC